MGKEEKPNALGRLKLCMCEPQVTEVDPWLLGNRDPLKALRQTPLKASLGTSNLVP